MKIEIECLKNCKRLTIVLVITKVVRSINVVKGRGPVINKLDMIWPYAQTAQVIFCIGRKQLLHCICCCFAQPRLLSHHKHKGIYPKLHKSFNLCHTKNEERWWWISKKNLSNSANCEMANSSPTMNDRKKKQQWTQSNYLDSATPHCFLCSQNHWKDAAHHIWWPFSAFIVTTQIWEWGLRLEKNLKLTVGPFLFLNFFFFFWARMEWISEFWIESYLDVIELRPR